MAHRTPDGKWRVRWRDETRKRRSQNFDTRPEALRFEADLDEGTVPVVKKESLLYGAWLDRYIAEHSRVHNEETTVRADEDIFRLYLRPEFERLRLDDLERAHLRQLQAKLKARLSAKTVNNVTTLAKQTLNIAVEFGELKASPWAGLKQLKVKRKAQRTWTASQRDLFTERCRNDEPEFWAIIVTAAFTGLRRGELKALQRHQLDFERRLIEVSATYSERLKRRFERVKNGDDDHVPMARPVLEALASRKDLPPAAPVFDQDLFSDLLGRFKRRCKWYGVPVLNLHQLRHTFSTTLAEAGVGDAKRQKLMRHKTRTMLDRYTHLQAERLRPDVNRLVLVPDLAPVEGQATGTDGPDSGKERSLQGSNLAGPIFSATQVTG